MTVETVTPPPSDADARARILRLADTMRGEDRVAALTLTDRTSADEADPVALAPEVTSRSGKHPLVHVAGKARTVAQVEEALRHAGDAGITNVLLTGGDLVPGVTGVQALEMLPLARRAVPALFRLAVLGASSGRSLDEAWRRVSAKREAGAEAFIAQAGWQLARLETIAGWQARVGAPVLGAVVVLTRQTLAFLDGHGFTGLAVPSSLRARVERESVDAALLRAALDVLVLRRLGYAGVHLSGLVTPALVTRVLDEATRLHEGLGDDWRPIWREAMGIA